MTGLGKSFLIIEVRETDLLSEKMQKSCGTTVPAFAYVRIWKHFRR